MIYSLVVHGQNKLLYVMNLIVSQYQVVWWYLQKVDSIYQLTQIVQPIKNGSSSVMSGHEIST